jgi:hypothetical protein
MFSVIKPLSEPKSPALKVQTICSSEMWKQNHYIHHFGSKICESLKTYQLYVSNHQVHSSNTEAS